MGEGRGEEEGRGGIIRVMLMMLRIWRRSYTEAQDHPSKLRASSSRVRVVADWQVKPHCRPSEVANGPWADAAGSMRPVWPPTPGGSRR